MSVCSTKEVRQVPLISNSQARGPLDNKYVWGLIFRQRTHLLLAGATIDKPLVCSVWIDTNLLTIVITHLLIT